MSLFPWAGTEPSWFVMKEFSDAGSGSWKPKTHRLRGFYGGSFAVAMEKDMKPEEMLKFASAVASANAMSPHTGDFDPAVFHRLFAEIIIGKSGDITGTNGRIKTKRRDGYTCKNQKQESKERIKSKNQKF